jgi:3-oxoacyl-[acyl-carrier protein] reductase
MRLSNAVALVTGGSGGLGARICTGLAAEGVDIAVGYFHGAERAEKVCGAIEALGRKSMAVRLDQTSIASIDGPVTL